MNKIATLFSLLLCAATVFAQNTPPVISVLSANVDEVAQKVNFTYNLADAQNQSCEVWLKFSKDGGTFFDTIPASELSGNVGTGIAPGNGKAFSWDYSSHAGSIFDTRIRIYASDGQPVSIADMVSAVDSNRLKNSMNYIQGIRHYNAGLAHLKEIRDSIQTSFNRYGLNTERDSFNYSTEPGYNILGRKAGAKNEAVTYVMDAHYDGVPTAPAADDNGSGVAGMLEALRILSQYNFEHSLRFLGFDYEELGLIGSQRYVLNQIKNYENIQGVLNYEMISYYKENVNSQTVPSGFNILFPTTYAAIQTDSFRGNFLIVCGNTASTSLTSKFMNTATQYVPDLKALSLEVPNNGQIAPDLRRSDHASFWDGGMNALMLTDGANTRNPNYHNAGDSIGTMNFTFMTNIVKATLATAAALAVPISSSYVERQLYPLLIDDHHDHTFPAQVEVYPNPTNGTLFLKVSTENGLRTKAELFDLQGKVVFSKVVEFAKGKSTVALKLNELPSGNYMLVLTSGESNLSKSIVIKGN